MSRDGSGNYTLPAGVNPVVSGTTITDDWANTTLADVATGLTDSWDRQGRGVPLANLSMGSFKLTSLAVGSAAADSVRYGQVVNQDTATIASASTVDLAGAIQSNITVSGTTTVTSFGTGASNGVIKYVTFTGALTLTHGSNLICPNSTNLAVAAGDTVQVRSEGSNVWRVVKSPQVTLTMPDGSVSAPGLAFANDANCGLFRTGSDNWGLSGGGYQFLNWGAAVNTVKLSCSTGSSSSVIVASDDTSSGAVTGNVTIKTGTGTSLGFAAGPLALSVGSANNPTTSNLTITGGAVTGSGQLAGDVVIRAGAGTAANSGGGSVTISPGASSASPTSNTAMVRLSMYNTSGVEKTVVALRQRECVLAYSTDAGSPTINSGGGTGGTIVGTNYGFRVTLGTSPAATLVIDLATFGGATTPNAPIATVSSSNTGYTCAVTTSVTQVTVTFSTTPTAADKINVITNYYSA